NAQCHGFVLEFSKSLRIHRYVVIARRQVGNDIKTRAARCGRIHVIGIKVSQTDLGLHDHATGLVADRAIQLGVRRTHLSGSGNIDNREQQKEERGAKSKLHRGPPGNGRKSFERSFALCRQAHKAYERKAYDPREFSICRRKSQEDIFMSNLSVFDKSSDSATITDFSAPVSAGHTTECAE